MLTFLLGEWLNGRVAVSKTVGCVFESRLPCQIVYCGCDTRFFYIELLFVSVRAFSHAKVASDAIRPFGQESLFRRFAPYESRLPCQIVYCLCDTRFFYIELLFVSVRAFSHAKVASDAIRPFGQESLFRRFAPYESQSPLPIRVLPLRYTIFLYVAQADAACRKSVLPARNKPRSAAINSIITDRTL